MSNYSNYTYHSKNVFKRFAHQKRFKRAIDLIQANDDIRLLDFGCGDGFFLNQLKESYSGKIDLLGFEPILDPIENNTVCIVNSWEKVQILVNSSDLNYVTCFEVLEYFTEQKQIELIEQIVSVLKKDGILIVSVPVETGIPSLIKNSIRKRSCNRKYQYLYSYKNIFYAFLGKPILDYRQGDDYLWEHIGFRFQDLEKIFSIYFHVLQKSYSPFGILGRHFNSQVFYKLQKKIRIGFT
ncbi:hypothetical protein AGMMS50262_08980 [Bacteroidia bacterium]|nr:hypothetical protein AGMMS50262_08980 [Bacteroidia bacterium]